MVKKLLLYAVFVVGSLNAMQPAGDANEFATFVAIYNQEYLLGSTAIAKMVAAGMSHGRAVVITRLMKHEQQKGLGQEQLAPRIAALTDLLQGQPNRYGQNQ